MEPADPAQVEALPEFQPAEPVQNRPGWRTILVNLVYVFLSSLVGMFSGAVVMYFGVAFFCASLFSNPNDNPSTACARGAAIAILSILSGGFLGTMSGSALAIKHPLCKPQIH